MCIHHAVVDAHGRQGGKQPRHGLGFATLLGLAID